MADFQQTFNSNGSVQIPSYAINVRVDIAGARGGPGGRDAGASRGEGGAGRRANIYFPNYTARRLDFYIGTQGGTGSGGSNGPGGSGGSSSAASGGRGGNSANNGSSGAGGGGGGASGIFDTFSNSWVAVLAGGGGGGGASLNASGSNGGTGRGLFSGNPNNRSVGGQGQKNNSEPSNRPDGAGGGGGGGGCGGGSGGAFGVDNNRGGAGGGGGASGFNSSYCSFNSNSGSSNLGNGFAVVYYDIALPTISNFSLSPTAFKRGECTTLSWSSTNASSASINQGVGAVGVNGSTVNCPTNTTTYTLTVFGNGLSATATATATVYVPPIFDISTNKTEMMLGDVANISWSVSGDGGGLNWTPTLTWLAGGLTNLNLTSNSNVTPSVTTVYTGQASGIGGTDTGSVTVVVYQPVELSVDYPDNLLYGNQGNISVTTKYATDSVTITPTYTYDFIGSNVGSAVNLPINDSAELGGTESTNEYTTTIPYNDRGALTVSYVVRATGKLGNFKEETFSITIIVDDTPENLNIPESEDLLKDQTPVVSPEVEVLSDLLLIDDIDIKVEIKSNYPIQVDLNQNDDWKDVRQL
ncbi:virion structural protein [Synechococcus phage ACG-2014j]|uniref:Virion structural protein n=1 Tax=Synechococcus phage ACG-2014j TaxID=1493514 RepID=A0A0E3F9Z7_9CAUD|nr:virion structural protein [Synechococcus phage ACG-2014j]AIX23927.1 virion structural protein [Synechococcus phage ACG-2014j]